MLPSTLNTETEFDPWLATNTNLPLESMTIASGFKPVLGGVAVIVVVLRAKAVRAAESVPEPQIAYSEIPPG